MAEGKAQGVAEGILSVLTHRGLDVSEDVKSRIMACTDLGQLQTWLDRAFSVDVAE